ncbi:MAG: alanine:cation symporter family protein, partial [Oscillospiraceae bacterium]|nr:alanine:cation symporter family protein [Oscillospiraceae bacterium]
GARCAQFLFGQGIWPWYVLALSIGAAYSAVADSAIVWQFSETMNGLMVIPNLITLALLTPEVRCLTKDYLKIRRINAGGGYYADFHQCKPL